MLPRIYKLIQTLDMSNVRSVEEIVVELEEDLEMADDEDAPSDAWVFFSHFLAKAFYTSFDILY